MRWNVLCKIFKWSKSRDPGSKLGSLSSTCSSSTCSLNGDLGKASKISDGWTKNSIGGLGEIIEGIFGSSRKRFKTERGRQEGTEVRELDKVAMFPKDNIARDTKMMRDKIITPMPLLSFTITKKIAKPRLRLKSVMLMWLKKNETGKTKGAKVLIFWKWPKKVHIEFDFGWQD